MAYRIERVNNLIRSEISELLQRQVKDPRLGNFVAVTSVSTTSDLRYARIFVSSVGGGVERQEILGVLASASGFIRSQLAKRLKIRRIPELSFQWDDSIERGAHLSQLIEKVATDSTLDREDGA